MKPNVPQASAYVACHDHYDHGAMEVWPMPDLDTAKNKAHDWQRRLDDQGLDGCHYAAYAELPRRRVFKVHVGVTA